jgi:rfaE bifunctional protein kinase chain/domain
MSPYARFFQELPGLRVAVVGDLMLDTYFFGQVDRISPEAPVPVVSQLHQEERIGGAGNVALNLSALGASVQLISLVGDDEPAQILVSLLRQSGIGIDLLRVDDKRPTTRKTRVLDRNKQLLRLDQESTQEAAESVQEEWLTQIESYLRKEQPQLLIFEDYNKGVLSTKIIQRLVSICKEMGMITTVDPKKENFFSYQGVDLFKPNWREVSEALQFNAVPDLIKLKEVHHSLHEKLDHQVSLITLSERGAFYQSSDQSEWLPGLPRNVVDVSGAGDTVIAVASAAYALTKDPACMANLANLAGGIVCEQVGTTPIDPMQLRSEVARLGWI